METRRDTSHVPNAMAIAGARAMIVLSGRLTRLTNSHTPPSARHKPHTHETIHYESDPALKRLHNSDDVREW
jgi:hypothetical protein